MDTFLAWRHEILFEMERLLYLEIVFAMFYIKFCSESNLNGKNLMTKQSFYCSNVLGQKDFFKCI